MAVMSNNLRSIVSNFRAQTETGHIFAPWRAMYRRLTSKEASPRRRRDEQIIGCKQADINGRFNLQVVRDRGRFIQWDSTTRIRSPIGQDCFWYADAVRAPSQTSRCNIKETKTYSWRLRPTVDSSLA